MRLKFSPFIFTLLLVILISAGGQALAHSKHSETTGQVTYLGNEGLLIDGGGYKLLFDPFFHNNFGIYQLVPEPDRKAMLSGKAPYGQVSGIFISHAHGDHFSAKDVVTFLNKNPSAVLVAPQQALEQIQGLPDVSLAEDRFISVALQFGQQPAHYDEKGLKFDVVRIPHAGWPGRADIENLVYRVTLPNGVVVMHMGDADPDVQHYLQFKSHWSLLETDTAFPPYWFFYSMEGRDILNVHLNARHSVGVHVPMAVPEFLLKENHPHFSRPGQVLRLDMH